ncbi:hypothetical protein J7M00_07585, partial [bacterium]|nr:hypothetical protein [bacterium]
TDSEFMTTYKYSNSEYTRKYLGLSQIKKLIQTFPLLCISKIQKQKFFKLIDDGDVKSILDFLEENNQNRRLSLCSSFV